TYTGFKLGQDESILSGSLLTPATVASNVGSYAITSNQTNANYAITTNNGLLAVTPALLTIDIDNKSKIYGDANPLLTATYTGFKLGQDESILSGSLLTPATVASDVGSYAITSNQTNANYTITTNDGLLAVTPALLTIDIDNKSKIYGDANPLLTATYTGFKLGQDESILSGSLLTPATITSNVGNYAITSSQTNANYAITTNDGILTITPVISVTPVTPTISTTNPSPVTQELITPEIKTIIINQVEADTTLIATNNIQYATTTNESTTTSINNNFIPADSSSEFINEEILPEDSSNDFTNEEISPEESPITPFESDNSMTGGETETYNNSVLKTSDKKSVSLTTINNVINDKTQTVEDFNYKQMSAIFNICKSSQSCSNINTEDNNLITDDSIFLNSPQNEIIADLKSTEYITEYGYHPSGLKGYLRTISIISALKAKALQNQNISSSENTNNEYKLNMNYRHPSTLKRLGLIQDLIYKKDLLNNTTKIIHKQNYEQKINNEIQITPKVRQILEIIHQYSIHKDYNDLKQN
ncbi:MAG: MBG domain-containing protein, partial [Vampirovibrionia bacterium]